MAVERIMVGVEEQAKEYQTLSNQMGKILQGLTKIKKDNPPPPVKQQTDKEPKIRKELCPDTLIMNSTPIKFRWDFLVYYKEFYMDKASLEGQKQYLLKCIEADLGERKKDTGEEPGQSSQRGRRTQQNTRKSKGS